MSTSYKIDPISPSSIPIDIMINGSRVTAYLSECKTTCPDPTALYPDHPIAMGRFYESNTDDVETFITLKLHGKDAVFANELLGQVAKKD
jgi:hypothetical protein